MCIIAIKGKGVDMPSEAIIRNMFQRNPDGAGIMWWDEDINKVRIEKGIMDIKTFLSKVKRFRSQDSVVMHFRIETSGGVIKANTHPFMISENVEDLKKLKACTDIGVVHNGIIDIFPSRKDISDTMEFIANRLSYISKAVPEFYKDKNVLTWIENEIQSKMCFLTGLGEIVTIGSFDEKDGVLYSNHTYESFKSSFKPYSYDWDNYDWDKYESILSAKNGTGKIASSDDIKKSLEKLEKEHDINKHCILYRIPQELMVFNEKNGGVYESEDFVIDDCMNIFEVIGYNHDLDCEEIVYDQLLSLVTLYGEPIDELDELELEQDFFYEIFM